MGGKPGLRSEEPVGEALVAFARDILREALIAIENPEHSDAVAVHDFRKAMKRWRAFLRLLEPLVGHDANHLRAEARDLARQLATARDVQSALDAVADLEKGDKGEATLSTTSLTTIRKRLDAVRQSAETTALTDSVRARMRAAIEAGGRAVEHWPLSELEFPQVARQLTTAYERARRIIPERWHDAEDEQLHEFRSRVVVHRYQMQLVEPLWPRLGKVWVGEAQRLRDRLGTHQDLAVLATLAAPHQPLAPWRSRLTPLIAARKAVHVAAAARIAGRLFAERPKAFRRRLMALWHGAGRH